MCLMRLGCCGSRTKAVNTQVQSASAKHFTLEFPGRPCAGGNLSNGGRREARVDVEVISALPLSGAFKFIAPYPYTSVGPSPPPIMALVLSLALVLLFLLSHCPRSRSHTALLTGPLLCSQRATRRLSLFLNANALLELEC